MIITDVPTINVKMETVLMTRYVAADMSAVIKDE